MVAAFEDPADAAMIDRVRVICLGLRGAEEGELQGRPLFHVRRRRFALFNGVSSPPRRRWDGAGRSLHFLVDPEERAALGLDGRFTPSPHHAVRGWFALSLERDVDWSEVAELLAAAHHQVAPPA